VLAGGTGLVGTFADLTGGTLLGDILLADVLWQNITLDLDQVGLLPDGTFIVGMDLDSDAAYVFGGTSLSTGPKLVVERSATLSDTDVDVFSFEQVETVYSISPTSNVPEPSQYAAFSGVLALAGVLLWRRRVQV
jgi:hypothetical protein